MKGYTIQTERLQQQWRDPLRKLIHIISQHITNHEFLNNAVSFRTNCGLFAQVDDINKLSLVDQDPTCMQCLVGHALKAETVIHTKAP